MIINKNKEKFVKTSNSNLLALTPSLRMVNMFGLSSNHLHQNYIQKRKYNIKKVAQQKEPDHAL